MHIPDGYLSPSTCAVFTAAMLPFWYRASAKLKETVETAQAPFIAMGAIFVFLVMMFNVPIPDGTTAHATGAALMAIVFGPWIAVIVVSVALFIQALVFGDGGILTFGANAFNMAVVLPFVSYFVYMALSRNAALHSARRIFAASAAGYIGINVAAFMASLEFGVQPMLFHTPDGTPLYCPYGLAVAVPAMLFAHLLVAGFVEGAVTGLALKYILRDSAHFVLTRLPGRSPEEAGHG